MTAELSYMDFPPEEFQARYRRAQELMERNGLDALMITSQRNYIYFTGHSATRTVPNWLWNLNDTRPFIAILPRNKQPFLVLHIIAESFSKGCWIQDHKVWAQEPFRAAYLVDALKEFGLTEGVIGCEFGDEQRLGLPLTELFAVQREMPGLQWVDASRLFWDMRIKKSPLEIKCIREANRITVEIGDEWVRQARAGMTGREAGNLLQRLALDAGADYLPLCLMFITGPNGAWEYPPATDRPILKGDLLYLDYGAQYRGYTADVNRMVYFGDPPDLIRQYYDKLAQLERFMMLQIRPGAALKEIRVALDGEFRRLGLPTKPYRAGHGIGMQPTEAPSINMESQVVLEPGMTITIEPAFPTPEGYFFSIEHDMLVTETGGENLTPAPLELLVVNR